MSNKTPRERTWPESDDALKLRNEAEFLTDNDQILDISELKSRTKSLIIQVQDFEHRKTGQITFQPMDERVMGGIATMNEVEFRYVAANEANRVLVWLKHLENGDLKT